MLLQMDGIGYAGQLPGDAVSRSGSETVSLPLDALSTLYVEGLPSDSKRREMAHIFCPFVGYREVRLVRKRTKHCGGDPLILCFLDFANPVYAATAMNNYTKESSLFVYVNHLTESFKYVIT
ncbi:hypothetical protein AHAS_Ahas12G0032500 [Arachis hypogaea]